MFRNSVRKAKTHRDVMTSRNLKNNKKIYCDYISSKTLKRKMGKGEGDVEARDTT